MKPFITLSVLFWWALSPAVFFTGCASTGESAAEPVSFPDPSPLDTQARMQKMHSDALRQEF